jgi:hypothetical protein
LNQAKPCDPAQIDPADLERMWHSFRRLVALRAGL